ncbi:MAG: chromate transporter [Clostridiales bacterium]|nr:chromate transporter [Clostridiales bacterium]
MKELFELYLSFFKIGILTFGGGYAMIPMLEREIVVNKKWATYDELMNYFAVSQCTPGVIAVNTATFIGYKKKGVIGGLFSTLGVITPSIIIICLLAGILDVFADNVYVKHAFAGISIAVCALMVSALIKMFKSGVKDVFTLVIAIAAIVFAFFFKVSNIIIVICAGIIGCIYKALSEKRKNASKSADKEGEK